jgi:polar amino acid transport system substrate-binding protein
MTRLIGPARVAGAACVAVLAVAALGACSSSGAGAPATSPATSSSASSGALTSLLPERIAQEGTLTVGLLSSGSSNMESTSESGKIVGFDPDLIEAIGKTLGVKVDIQPAAFDSLIAGIQSGRYDVTLAEMADTKTRQQNVSFVDYLTVGLGLIVKKDNPAHVQGINDLCGRTVAVLTGGYPADVAVPALSTQCTKAGKPAVHASSYSALTQTVLAVQSGRADCFYNSQSTVAYILRTTPGQFEQAGSSQTLARAGIAFGKDDPQLGKALQAALQALIKSGEYAAIAKRWGLSNVTIPAATINNALI